MSDPAKNADGVRVHVHPAAMFAKVRNHNERAILTALRRRGPLAGTELARALQVSAQTASVITRLLEGDGLLKKGQPIKGKVGKPQIPVMLRPDGAFAFGLRIGRRGADLLLMDLTGKIRTRAEATFQYPSPDKIESFLVKEVANARQAIGVSGASRIVGIGLAMPHEIWSWLDALGVPKAQADAWRGYDLETELGRITGLPVGRANDVNMACNGELVFGIGSELPDFAYFYVGSFVGGGIALSGQVFHGPRGNAGAFGSLPSTDRPSRTRQLIHNASLFKLEQRICSLEGRSVNLRSEEVLWLRHTVEVDAWLSRTARALAEAIVAVVSVLDLPAIVIDGGIPADVRHRLLQATREAIHDVPRTGLNDFVLLEGTLGREAGALGAAHQPLQSAHFLEGSLLV